MRPQEIGGPPAASVSLAQPQMSGLWFGLSSFVGKTMTIVGLEIRKLRHDSTELVTRAIQPALWLLVFGQVFTRVRVIPTGDLRYIDFMAPGVLAQSVLFIAIF